MAPDVTPDVAAKAPSLTQRAATAWSVLWGNEAASSDQRLMTGTANTPVTTSTQLYPQLPTDLYQAMKDSPEFMAGLGITAGKLLGLKWELIDTRVRDSKPGRQTQQSSIPQTNFDNAYRLLNNPNPKFPTYSRFVRRAWTDYMVVGKAVIEIETEDGSPTGKPVGLWNIPAGQVSAGPRNSNGLPKDPNKAWVQRTTGGKERYLRDDQILLITRQPSYDLSGELSMRVLLNTINARKLVEERMRLDFSVQGYGARRIMNFPGRTEGWLTTLRDKLKTRFADATTESSISILTNSEKSPDVKSMTDTNQELMLFNYLEELSRQLANYFHISMLELNFSQSSNRSTSATQQKMHIQGGLKADFEEFEDAFTMVARRFHPFLAFEFPHLDSFDPETEEKLRAMKLAYLTPDEIRAMDNYDPLPNDEGKHLVSTTKQAKSSGTTTKDGGDVDVADPNAPRNEPSERYAELEIAGVGGSNGYH